MHGDPRLVERHRDAREEVERDDREQRPPPEAGALAHADDHRQERDREQRPPERPRLAVDAGREEQPHPCEGEEREVGRVPGPRPREHRDERDRRREHCERADRLPREEVRRRRGEARRKPGERDPEVAGAGVERGAEDRPQVELPADPRAQGQRREERGPGEAVTPRLDEGDRERGQHRRLARQHGGHGTGERGAPRAASVQPQRGDHERQRRGVGRAAQHRARHPRAACRRERPPCGTPLVGEPAREEEHRADPEAPAQHLVEQDRRRRVPERQRPGEHRHQDPGRPVPRRVEVAAGLETAEERIRGQRRVHEPVVARGPDGRDRGERRRQAVVVVDDQQRADIRAPPAAHDHADDEEPAERRHERHEARRRAGGEARSAQEPTGRCEDRRRLHALLKFNTERRSRNPGRRHQWRSQWMNDTAPRPAQVRLAPRIHLRSPGERDIGVAVRGGLSAQ